MNSNFTAIGLTRFGIKLSANCDRMNIRDVFQYVVGLKINDMIQFCFN